MEAVIYHEQNKKSLQMQGFLISFIIVKYKNHQQYIDCRSQMKLHQTIEKPLLEQLLLVYPIGQLDEVSLILIPQILKLMGFEYNQGGLN